MGLPPDRDEVLTQIETAGSRALDKAQALFDQGRLDEAEAGCAEVNRIWQSKNGSMASGVAHLLGRIRMRQGRYAEAVRIMEPNIDGNDLHRLDLALCYAKTGSLARARELYDPSLITDYTSAFGDVRRYVPPIRSAADLEAALLWCKGVALGNVSRSDEATDCYKRALAQFPRNALLAARLALAAENAGRDEDAALGYRAVLNSGDSSLRDQLRYNAERAIGRAKQAKAKKL